MTKHPGRALAAVALLASVVCAGPLGVVSVRAKDAKAPSFSQKYADLSRYPDWTGWGTYAEPFRVALTRDPPPMKGDGFANFRAAFQRDTDPDPARYCRPVQFAGYSGGFTEHLEFLLTPGRLTMTNEGGLIRRIYIDGRSLPEHPEETNMGTSVGRWEGQALI